jgi:hypothetical protein
MSFFETLTTVAIWIATVAIVALVVSRKSQTPEVVQSVGSAYGNALAVAEAPVTGAATPINLSYPTSGYGYGGFSPSIQNPGF